MTTEHIAKMRAGKDAADAARRHEWAESQRRYMDWLEREAASFQLRAHVEELHTRDSAEWRLADECWHSLLKSMPTPPPDHGWTR